jgi:hypothetical protein
VSAEQVVGAGKDTAGGDGALDEVVAGPIGRRAAGRHRRTSWAPVVVAWVVVVAAGCGGASAPTGAAGTPAAPTPVPASAPAATATVAPAPEAPAPEVSEPGDIPDNQVFVPFTAPGGIVVSVPEGWARSADGPATVFTDKYNSVRVEVRSRSTPADVAGSRSTEVSQLRTAVPGFTLTDVRKVPRKAGTAVLITYEANSPANPVTGRSVRESVERYAFWNGGREAVLTLSGAKGADNLDPWRIVTDSLRWRA